MGETCATVKVKAPVTEDNPTGFIVINESDFTPGDHELFDDDDSASEGKLTVAKIKEALTAKGVAIPDGAKKAELFALLQAS